MVIKFILFSLSAGLIQSASFILFDAVFTWPWALSYIMALLLSIIWNFILNRKITFKSSCNIWQAIIKVLIFYLIFIPCSTYFGIQLVMLGLSHILANYLNMILNMWLEYLYDKFIVFN